MSGLLSFPLNKGIDGCITFLILVFLGLIFLAISMCIYFLLRRWINKTRDNNHITITNGMYPVTNIYIKFINYYFNI